MSTSQRYDTQDSCANAPNADISAHQAISLDSPPTVRQYFEKVRELLKSGNPFPVKLDEVWQLVYTRKGDAVRALSNDFIENIDYQPLRNFAKRTKGGQNEVTYELTVPCMEWLIARKVRAVFDVYREVFHRTLDLAEQAVPQTQLVELINVLTDKVNGLESKLKRIHRERNQYFRSLIAWRHRQERLRQEAESKTNAKREHQELFELLARYMKVHSYQSGDTIIGHILDRMERFYNADLKKAKREPGEHYFDVAIRNGFGHCIAEVIKCHLHESGKLR